MVSQPNSAQIVDRVVSIQESWDEPTRLRRHEAGRTRRQALIRLLSASLIESDEEAPLANAAS